MNLVEVKQVSKTYGKNTILDTVDLNIQKGSFIALVGMSGGGKSTLMRMIAGLEEATSGVIVFNGHKVRGLNKEARIMFQDDRLLPWMTVMENLTFANKSPEKLAKAKELLELTDLTEHYDKYPTALSGGQRQRVALARALMSEPKLLLLDEPLGALDALTRQKMQNLILDICQKQAITTVLVTHDIAEAVRMADKIYVIKDQGISGRFDNSNYTGSADEQRLQRDHTEQKVLDVIYGI